MFNKFFYGLCLGLIIGFLASQLDGKHMIEKGYIHNVFIGKIGVKDEY